MCIKCDNAIQFQVIRLNYCDLAAASKVSFFVCDFGAVVQFISMLPDLQCTLNVIFCMYYASLYNNQLVIIR